MKSNHNLRLSKSSQRKYKIRFVSATILSLMLIINTVSVSAVSIPLKSKNGPGQQSISTLTFTAQADARVEESNPAVNFGTSDYLEVFSAEGQNIESYTRFTVSGLTGIIQNATFRVYSTTPVTNNGPAVYATNTTWSETGLTWNNRWARMSGAINSQAAISGNSWVEYDVTSLVTGDDEYAFLLAGDISNSLRFSSREGGNAPQLVITVSAPDTPTSIQESTQTNTPASTAIFTDTATSAATVSNTPTLATETTPSLTPTVTEVSTTPLTFMPDADARVVQIFPMLNFGASRYLQSDGNTGAVVTTYIRFTVSGISGSSQHVMLRVFCTTNGSTNGPAVYMADNNWIESGIGGITWITQPALLSGAADNKSAVETNSWIEYDVTSLVTGDGTYTFALVADSTDGITVSSREGLTPPQLVVTPGTDISTATPTPSASPSTFTATPVPSTSATTPTLTPVPPNSPTPTPTTSSNGVVLVGAGDISTCGNDNDEATAKLLDAISGTVFVAGDNAYTSGSYTQYLNCYDPTWGRHKARTNPVPGNHEYVTAGAAGYFQYFNNVPAFYAYNLGTWRIYALNSEIDVSASSHQATWLQGDISANPSQCVLAYWHKPRWSSGITHGNNSSMQALWQILSNAGAELVISGHEHNYERFAEMDGSGSAVFNGMREFVVGTGGAAHYGFGTPLAASEVRDSTSYGVLKLTLRDTGYDWQFVPVAGATFTDNGSGNCH